MTDLVTTGEPVAPIEWTPLQSGPSPWRAQERGAEDWAVVRDGPQGLEYAMMALGTHHASEEPAIEHAARLNAPPLVLNAAEQMRDYGVDLGAEGVIVMVAMPSVDGQHPVHWVYRGNSKLCNGVLASCMAALTEALQKAGADAPADHG